MNVSFIFNHGAYLTWLDVDQLMSKTLSALWLLQATGVDNMPIKMFHHKSIAIEDYHID